MSDSPRISSPSFKPPKVQLQTETKLHLETEPLISSSSTSQKIEEIEVLEIKHEIDTAIAHDQKTPERKDPEKYQEFITTIQDINEDFCNEIEYCTETMQKSANNIALSISQTSTSWAAGNINSKGDLSVKEVDRRLLLLKNTLKDME